MGYVRVTDAQMDRLAGKLVKLKRLVLDGTRLTNDGVSKIARVGQLQYLKIWNSHVHGRTLAELASLTNLVGLQIIGDPIDTSGIESLTRFAHLRELGLPGVTAADLRLLVRGGQLEKLFLDHADLTRWLARGPVRSTVYRVCGWLT